MIFGTKTNRIDENPLGVRPARLHGNIVDIGVQIIPVRIFHIFSNFSAQTIRLREKEVAKSYFLCADFSIESVVQVPDP